MPALEVKPTWPARYASLNEVYGLPDRLLGLELVVDVSPAEEASQVGEVERPILLRRVVGDGLLEEGVVVGVEVQHLDYLEPALDGGADGCAALRGGAGAALAAGGGATGRGQ